MTIPKQLDASWERREAQFHAVTATSPDGTQLVAQWEAPAGPARAAIWDVATRKIAWEPAGATSACWAGDQLLVTRLDGARRQEVVDWYEAGARRHLGTTPIAYPIGAWLTHPPVIAASPTGDVAAVRWIDQTEGGFELLRRRESGWEHIRSHGYHCGSNMVSDLAFSVDGHRLALAFGPPIDREWWREARDDGTTSPGFVAVLDTTTGGLAFVDLVISTPPATWSPDPKRSPAPEVLRCDRSEVEVELQTGDRVTLPLAGASFQLPKA